MWGKAIFLVVVLGVAGTSAVCSLIPGLCDTIARTLVSTDVNTLKFYYCPTASQKIEIVYGDTASLAASGLVAGAPTTLVIDGFLSTSETPMAVATRTALLANTVGRNVIVLDWGSMSGGVSGITELSAPLALAMYPLVILNVSPVGQRVAEFLEFLRANKDIDQSSVHIIGHSMGAHIAGKAGSYSISNYDSIVAQLTGLDPAGPVYYVSLSPDDMIYKGNGAFVDLYHTSRGKLGDSRTGTGDIDVYFNGGSVQPGCTAFEVVPGTCDHYYSWRVYNASVYGADLFGCPCSATEPLLAPTCFCETGCGDVSTCSGAIPIMFEASPFNGLGEFHTTTTDSFQ